MNTNNTNYKDADALKRILESQLTNSQDFMKRLEQNLNYAEVALEEKRRLTAHNRRLALRTILTGIIASAAIIIIAAATQESGSIYTILYTIITACLANIAILTVTLQGTGHRNYISNLKKR